MRKQRPFLLLLHCTLGWLALLPALYMASTGIASALADQIERIVEPELFGVEPVPGAALSLSDIESKVDAILADVEFKIMPREGIFDTITVIYNSPEKRIMWLNPYTGAVIADRDITSRPGTIIHDLHTGRFFGIGGIALLFSIVMLFFMVSGLFYFRSRSRGRRFWHIQLGLLSSPVVLLLVVSGISLYFVPASWLYSLHTGEHIAIRMILVISLFIFVLSLLAFGLRPAGEK